MLKKIMVETFYRSREPKLGEKNPEPVRNGPAP